jgi:hypothetical protein
MCLISKVLPLNLAANRALQRSPAMNSRATVPQTSIRQYTLSFHSSSQGLAIDNLCFSTGAAAIVGTHWAFIGSAIVTIILDTRGNIFRGYTPIMWVGPALGKEELPKGDRRDLFVRVLFSLEATNRMFQPGNLH